MTAYTNISNALVAVGAKPFATTIQALRDNPIAIAEADASVPNAMRPTVLLGTINTTSGTTQTLSGLVLTPYRFFVAAFNGVSGTVSTGTATYTFAGHNNIFPIVGFTATAMRGTFWVDLASGAGWSRTANISAAAPATATPTDFVLRSSITASTTSVSISIAGTGAAFNGGSVLIYGVK